VDEKTKKFEERYEARVTPGRSGQDTDAPDWEVIEVKGEQTEVACDNLTQAEAQKLAEMWSRKRDEAEAEA
jgi:hypothetical protein